MTSRKRSGSRGWVPNHHGAWAMLVLPYVVGLIWAASGGTVTWGIGLLGLAWIVGYFAFFATATWLKSRFQPRYRAAVITYCVAAAVLAGAVLVAQPGWWTWGLVFGPLTAVGLWLAWRRRERSLVSGLATVAAASTLPLVIGSASLLELGGLPVLAGVSLVCFGYFFGTVLYVKTNIRERGRHEFVAYSVAWHLACTVGVTAVDLGLPRWWLAAFFVLCVLRAWLVPRWGQRGRWLSAKHLGIGEIVLTCALAAILVPGVVVG